MRLSKLALALYMAGLLSLALPALSQEATATPETAPAEETFHVTRYQGDGFSLLIPSNATVKMQGEKTIVFGPQVSYRDAGSGSSYHDVYAYALTIEVQANPNRLTGEAFALEQIRRTWDHIQATGAPLGGLPVDSDGNVREDAVAHRTLDGLPAFEVVYFVFDGYEHNFYVNRGDRMVVLVYNDYSFDKNPLAKVQLDIYALLLATLNFDEVVAAD